MPCEVLCITLSSSFKAYLTAVHKCPQRSAGHAKQHAVMQHAANSHISHLGVSVVFIQQDILGLQSRKILSIAMFLSGHMSTTLSITVSPHLEIMVYNLQTHDKD